MFDGWEFSSNFLSCSPLDQSTSFYPTAESLAEQRPKEDFYWDPKLVASALFPTPSSKRERAESIPTHDIQNCVGRFGDSALCSGAPLQLSLSESTLRSLNLQECISYPQTSSSADYNTSETFDSSQSQWSHSSESDRIMSDRIYPKNYGAPIPPVAQQLFSIEDMESQHKMFQNLEAARGMMDQFEETRASEGFLHGLPHPGLYSSNRVPIIDNSAVPVPAIPYVVNCCVEPLNNSFDNSSSTHGRIRPPNEFKENKPRVVRREIDKTDGSSGNNTSKIKRFPCPQCGQKFARAFNLQTHIATHAGTRPFSCPVEGCYKAFSRRHDLGRHMTAVHQQWLAVRNLSVAEAVKSLHWKKNKNSTHGRRNRTKHSHQS